MRWMGLGLTAVVLATLAPAEALAAPKFGYGRLAPGGDPETRVTRPLLTILVDFSDRQFAAHHTRAFYRRLVQGPEFPNVAGYFAEVSNGKFQISGAGVVGPYRMPDDPDTRADESTANCLQGRKAGCNTSSRSDESDRAFALRSAAAAGFDFQRFDTNGDGVVSDDELLVMLILASDGTCGASRGVDPSPLSVGRGVRQVDIALGGVGGFAENANFA